MNISKLIPRVTMEGGRHQACSQLHVCGEEFAIAWWGWINHG